MTYCYDLLEDIGLELVWFDSLGAKSSSVLVMGRDCNILIDPGAAEMQPGFPLGDLEKEIIRFKAIQLIEYYAARSKVLIITHYHYDHHVRVDDIALNDPRRFYLRGKLIIAKNPNKYINLAQWDRAREWLKGVLELLGENIDKYLEEPREEEFPDPVEELKEAHERPWGSYAERRRELLEKGKKTFLNMVNRWKQCPWIKERIELPDGTRILFNDYADIEVCGVRIKLLGPWFHGVEYDRVGWVTPILLEASNHRILFTSDLMGPMIEDYASRIIGLKPEVLIADGPPTYLFPYMVNRINLNRAVDNMVRILEETSSLKLVIYDHHLLRERRWRKWVEKVFEASKRVGVPVLTAAECLGQLPMIDTL